MGLYSFALLLLFIMPGPVWAALIARSLKSGFAGAWPLALGVALGDIILIALISALVPFIRNLSLGLAVGRARQLVSSVSARRRLNQASGIILILVGGLILVTV